MRFLCAINLLALTNLLGHASATPLPSLDSPQSLSPRGKRVCANAPSIEAGSNSQLSLSTRDLILTPRSPAGSGAGAPSLWWCAPHSETFILITITRTMVENGIHNLLSTSFNSIISHILSHGDGLINQGTFTWTEANAAASLASGGADFVASSSSSAWAGPPPTGLALHVWNANNHQVSFGVLCAVLTAIIEFMEANGWGAATFQIFDGQNMVGAGNIG